MWKENQITPGDLVWIWDGQNDIPKNVLVIEKYAVTEDKLFEYLVLLPGNELLAVPGIMIYKSYEECLNGKFKTRFF
jgi:hypothetical protein